MARKRGTHADQRRAGRFASLPHDVLESAAWRTASLPARAVLVELIRRHSGYNNGEIGAAQRDLAAALATTNLRLIGKACAELIERGLIDVGREAQRWNRQSREYRLTWLPTGEPPHRRPPTDEWKLFSDDEASSRTRFRDDKASSSPSRLDDEASSRIARSRQKTAETRGCG